MIDTARLDEMIAGIQNDMLETERALLRMEGALLTLQQLRKESEEKPEDAKEPEACES